MVCRIVMACLILHNLLRQQYPTGQYDDFSQDGQPEPDLLEENDLPYEGRNPMEFAKRQRNILKDYFNNEGQVPWQIDRL